MKGQSMLKSRPLKAAGIDRKFCGELAEVASNRLRFGRPRSNSNSARAGWEAYPTEVLPAGLARVLLRGWGEPVDGYSIWRMV